MPEPAVAIRPLARDDLPAYKALRDALLAAHPEAFTSDAQAERSRSADSYRPRLGGGDASGHAEGGHFLLGAWHGAALIGALGSERDACVKVRHIAHLIGMMVRPEQRGAGIGEALLQAALARLRAAGGIELVTLTVTQGNGPATRLYERAGFARYGSLPRAIFVGAQYHAKDHMVLTL